jgi:hypothetical protein
MNNRLCYIRFTTSDRAEPLHYAHDRIASLSKGILLCARVSRLSKLLK